MEKLTEKLLDDSASLEPGDVVGAVLQLGDQAVMEFLSELRPHARAVMLGEKDSCKGMEGYLRECTVSAAVFQQAGGIEAYHERAAKYRKGSKVIGVDDALAAIAELKFQ